MAARRGWLATNRWLLRRRTSQLGIIALFLLGPLAGVWLISGNLSASLLLDTVPMTDPFLWLQSLAAGHFAWTAGGLVGVALVVAFYAVIGGRGYCAWVCPLNPVTDLAAWLRERLGIKGGLTLSRATRYWLLGVVLLVAAATGTSAWEWLNPVSTTHRGLIFGAGSGWFGWWLLAVAGVLLFDLLLMRHGWCGHLCPMGATWAQIGRFSLIRIRADRRDACNDCLACFAVCPEPQVIRPPLKGGQEGVGPVIDSAACNQCGRCIDVCSEEVFAFGMRVPNRGEKKP